MRVWFSSFLEKALVNRVNRRIDIRIVRLYRSTKLVLMCAGSGRPLMWMTCVPVQSPGLCTGPLRSGRGPGAVPVGLISMA